MKSVAHITNYLMTQNKMTLCQRAFGLNECQLAYLNPAIPLRAHKSFNNDDPLTTPLLFKHPSARDSSKISRK